MDGALIINKHVYVRISDIREDFRTLPKDTDVSLGEDAVLKCSSPKGHPAPVIRWKKDGEYIDLSANSR